MTCHRFPLLLHPGVFLSSLARLQVQEIKNKSSYFHCHQVNPSVLLLPRLSHLHPQGEDGHIWQLWKVSPLEPLRLGPIKAHNSGFPSFFDKSGLEKPFSFSCHLSNLDLAYQLQGLVTLGILYFLLRVFPFCLPEYPASFLPFWFVCLFCF